VEEFQKGLQARNGQNELSLLEAKCLFCKKIRPPAFPELGSEAL